MPHVRPATVDDIETIVRYSAALARESEDKSLDLATLRDGVTSALALPDECAFFMAELDGRVVGQTMVTFEWSDWRNGRFWWIQSVYVEEPFRRRGVFRALFEYIRAAALKDGIACGLRLYVEEGNDRARRTYEQLGMLPTGYIVLEHCWKDIPGADGA